jgi:hypothetical protein
MSPPGPLPLIGRSPGVVHRLALAASLILIAASTLFKTRGNDIWWHIRTGQWIWEHGALPTSDPFSHTFQGAPWHNVDWLAQLLLFGLHRLGGIEAVVWAKSLLVLASLALLAGWLGLWRPAPPADRPAPGDRIALGPAVLVLCLAAVAMHFRLVLKPALFSLLAFTALFGLLRGFCDRGRWLRLLWVPPLVLLWANLHRGAPLALALLAAAIAASGLQRQRRGLLLPLGLTGLAAAGALLLNPSGSYIITSVFRESVTQVQPTADWSPLALDLPWLSIPVFLGLAAAWATGWAIRRRRLDFTSLVVLGCTLLAFRAVRFIPYAAIAMVPGLAADASSLLRRIADRLAGRVRPAVWQALLGGIGWAVLIQISLISYPPGVRGPGMARWLLPVDAAAFIAAHPPPGDMWNPLDFGGYLLFRLAPEIPVFVDGRSDAVYPRPFFLETLAAGRSYPVLARQLERHAIGFAVLDARPQRRAALRPLFRDPDWVLVYWDDLCAIMVRRTPAAAAYLARFGYAQLRVGSALPRLLNWPAASGRPALARDILANLRRAPRSIWARVLAMLLFRAQDRTAAEREQRRIIEALAAERGLELDLP